MCLRSATAAASCSLQAPRFLAPARQVAGTTGIQPPPPPSAYHRENYAENGSYRAVIFQNVIRIHGRRANLIVLAPKRKVQLHILKTR